MNSTATGFDTHKFVKDLIKVKVPEEQAEVFAEQQFAILNTHVATKGDVDGVKKEIEAARTAAKTDTELLRKDLESSESRTDAKVAKLENRLTRFMIILAGLIIAATVLTFTILMQYSGGDT